MLLAGKTIVIIGGTSGLGESGTLACLRAGANVVAVGRTTQSCRRLEEAATGPVTTLAGDGSDPETAERAIEKASSTFGGFDGLYHVAGASGRQFGDGPLHDIPPEGWRATLAANLDSAMYSTQSALKQFLAQKSAGAILLMSSVLAHAPAPRHFATHAYATSKAAIIGMAKSTAAFYAHHNVRLNVVAPALVRTSMSNRACEDPQIAEYTQIRQPLDGGRIGLPSDLDDAVVFLLSDGSRYVTGQVLNVDGGWSISDGAPPSV